MLPDSQASKRQDINGIYQSRTTMGDWDEGNLTEGQAVGTARSMPGNAPRKSSRLRRYLKKIYLLYVMWRAMRQCHYVMGGLLGHRR
jgi:hypothetical protein